MNISKKKYVTSMLLVMPDLRLPHSRFIASTRRSENLVVEHKSSFRDYYPIY